MAFNSISTFEPNDLAVRAWPSSWTRIDTNTITTQATIRDTSPPRIPNRAAISKKEGRTVTGTPKRRNESMESCWLKSAALQ